MRQKSIKVLTDKNYTKISKDSEFSSNIAQGKELGIKFFIYYMWKRSMSIVLLQETSK